MWREVRRRGAGRGGVKVLGGDVGEGAVTRGEAATSTGLAGTRWPREGFGGRRAHRGAVGAACSAPSVNSCFLILSGGSRLGVCNPVVTAHKNFTPLVSEGYRAPP